MATARDISEATGIDLQVVYSLARQGVLPSIQLGRMRRFDAGQVLQFLASGGTAGEEGDS